MRISNKAWTGPISAHALNIPLTVSLWIEKSFLRRRFRIATTDELTLVHVSKAVWSFCVQVLVGWSMLQTKRSNLSAARQQNKYKAAWKKVEEKMRQGSCCNVKDKWLHKQCEHRRKLTHTNNNGGQGFPFFVFVRKGRLAGGFWSSISTYRDSVGSRWLPSGPRLCRYSTE